MNRARPRSFRSVPYLTTADLYCCPGDQRLGHRLPSGRENSSEGRPRDPHSAGCFLLVQTFQIGEPKRFEAVQGQRQGFEFGKGNAVRFEQAIA